jgi:SCP-2 sterol transfer family
LPTFADANDIYSRIGRLMLDLESDPELQPVFLEANTCVRYELRNPDAAITVGSRGGLPVRVDFGPSEQEPEVVISMDADVAHSYLLGELDMTVALARGQMTAEGPVTKLLAVLPIFEPLLPRYRALVSGTNGRGSARSDEAPRPGL